jgi:hypothetical protein
VEHILDVMHYEKKKCESIIKIIFKEKDIMVIHSNMEEAVIQPQLWLQQATNFMYISLMHLMSKP